MDTELKPNLDYFGKIWKLRYFWLHLVKIDINNRYRRSFLGIAWSLIRPLGMTVVLCLVFRKILNVAVADYAPFLFLGLTIWQFLVEVMVQGCNSFNLGTTFIRQQKVPLAIFPLRTTLCAAFHFAVAFATSILIIWYFKGEFDLLALVTVLPGVVLLFFLGWFLAAIFGMLHTRFPDTQHCMDILLQVLFYLTPIFYSVDLIKDRGLWISVIDLNPLASLIEIIRSPMLMGRVADLYHFGVALGFVATVGLIAMLALRKLERDLVFWVQQ